MGKTAADIGANTFQFFTRNPRGGAAKKLDPDDIAAFLVFAAENDISQILNEILWEDMQTTVLLETMAGKGSEIGRSFEELRMIIDRVELNGKLGVCLDTCHIWEGGYDIVSDLDGVLETFDKVIGLDRLKAVHLNDSKNPMSAHKDRHEKIGEGHIGLETIEKVINHPALCHLPFYLETPNELDGYQREIALLKTLWHGEK